MLAQRIVTAAVLLAILVPAIFLAAPWVWGVLSLAILAAAALEWGRLFGTQAAAIRLAALLAAAGAGYLLWRLALPEPAQPLPTPAALALAAVSLLFWLAGAPAALARGRPIEPSWSVALLTLIACWVAVLELRILGAAMLVSCLVLVWVADVGAYFAGRAFGRRKLAPRISPGKSWEGVAGGLVAVLAVGLLAAAVAPQANLWPARLAQHLPWPALALALAILVALSVIGDLYESLLKRTAGVKDSGQLLPGHGGVLDRVDALVPTMPACLLALLVLR
ncbi:MAG TPA: phosphatidate cytidylyltransferase [Burkholderiaceae bacterium]|nr:phosphatidate cytidylyltransferase [Burkholderiaceae bacterium]